MTAAEKAKELVTTFTWQRDEHEKYVAKEMAKSCVDEIINTVSELHVIADSEGILVSMKYWEQVKVEINEL